MFLSHSRTMTIVFTVRLHLFCRSYLATCWIVLFALRLVFTSHSHLSISMFNRFWRLYAMFLFIFLLFFVLKHAHIRSSFLSEFCAQQFFVSLKWPNFLFFLRFYFFILTVFCTAHHPIRKNSSNTFRSFVAHQPLAMIRSLSIFCVRLFELFLIFLLQSIKLLLSFNSCNSKLFEIACFTHFECFILCFVQEFNLL